MNSNKLTKQVACVPGYESFWSFSSTRLGYSGVCTYVASPQWSPTAAEVDCLPGQGNEDINSEGRYVQSGLRWAGGLQCGTHTLCNIMMIIDTHCKHAAADSTSTLHKHTVGCDIFHYAGVISLYFTPIRRTLYFTMHAIPHTCTGWCRLK